MRIDIDAGRQARAEAEHEPKELVVGGEVYSLPDELQFSVAEKLDASDFRGAFADLLGPERAEAFFASGVSLDDLRFFQTELLRVYGGGAVGEAQDSPGSSKPTSTRSRSRSSGSTGSTSEPASGAKRPLASAG